MSYIYGEEIEVVTKKVRKINAVQCDVCKKSIVPTSSVGVGYNEHRRKTRYFDVVTGHHDWGNDSSDSIEHRHICPDCIAEYVKNYLGEAGGSEYIEIETEYVYNGMREGCV